MARAGVKSRTLLHPRPTRLTSQQIDALDELQKATGMSVSEHIRRAVDQYLTTMKKAR